MRKTLIILISFLCFLACKKENKKENPEANFSFNPTEIGAKDTIFFTNESKNADRYLWDFGDGNTSEQTNPFHVFQEKGTYNIALKAYKDDDYSMYHKAANISNIEFKRSDLIQIGESIEYKMFHEAFSDTTFQIGISGENLQWDFTAIDGYLSDYSITAQSNSNFPEADSLAAKSDIVLLSSENPGYDRNDFLTVDYNGVHSLGHYNDNSAGNEVLIVYDTPLKILQFPLRYEDEFESSTIVSSVLDSSKGKPTHKKQDEINLRFKVDGAGILITKYNSYECIRMKEDWIINTQEYQCKDGEWILAKTESRETRIYRYFSKAFGWYICTVYTDQNDIVQQFILIDDAP